MRIIIAAEPLENGAGLATFTMDTTAELACSRPDWQFVMLARSCFDDAVSLNKYPNIKIIFYDKLGLRGKLSNILPRFSGRERLFDYISNVPFSRGLRKQFGNLAEVWQNLDKYDAVWIPHFAISQNRWPALYHSGTLKAPALLSIHDLHAAVFPDEWKHAPKALNNFWHHFKPFARQTACIITHSHFQKQSIIKHFELPAEKIIVAYIPLPIDERLIETYPENIAIEVLTRHGIAKPYVFCPLSQTPLHKNHLTAIEAWGLLKTDLGQNCPQLVFTAIAKPYRQKVFNEAIHRLGLEGKVIFTGTISRRDICILYQNCQAVLSPTMYEGGGSGQVIEGTVVGKPIASSNIPVVVEHNNRLGINVVYFDPVDKNSMADAILKVITLPSKEPQRVFEEIKKNDLINRKKYAEIYLSEFENIAQNKLK